MFRVPRVGLVAGSLRRRGHDRPQRAGPGPPRRRRGLRRPHRLARRFKDDVREVAEGFECGIGIENFNDVKEGDIIEAYEVREVAREL